MIYRHLLASHDDTMLFIRSEQPSVYGVYEHKQRRRSRYRVMSDRLRSRCSETTYYLEHNPGIHPGILGVNRMIHNEASHVLYSSHRFDFDLDIEAVVPFLSDLTPCALSSIKRIDIIKCALPCVKDFDRREWRKICDFMSNNMQLVELGLGVIGGQPACDWEVKDNFVEEDFKLISSFECMEWVGQITQIKGLHKLDVRAHLQPCQQPCTNFMTFFVNFSGSIENGFAEFLKSEMVAEIH